MVHVGGLTHLYPGALNEGMYGCVWKGGGGGSRCVSYMIVEGQRKIAMSVGDVIVDSSRGTALAEVTRVIGISI